MKGLRADTPFARQVANGLSDQLFKVVDIGWPGGVAPGWSVFGDRFRALVVTPDAGAAGPIEDASPGTRIAIEDLQPLGPFQPTPRPARLSVDRTRDVQAGAAGDIETWVRQAAAASPPDRPASGEPARALGERLAERIVAEGFADADFVRIDAEGADLEILTGAESLFRRQGLLAVMIKGRLFGSADSRDNSLHNLDRLLRDYGFQPFTLEPLRYSLAALPAPYMDRHPDHTAGGRTMTALSLYMRDLCQPGAAEALAPTSIAKAAALFAMFDLPDCAAELLIVHRDRLDAGGIDVDAGLDQLALQAQRDYGTDLTYQQYIEAFDRNDQRFYDVYGSQTTWLNRLIATSREAPETIARLSAKIKEVTRRTGAGGARRSTTPQDLKAIRRSDIDPKHHWIFDHFDAYRGPATEEFYRDYIGARIRPTFESWGPAVVNPNWVAPMPEIDEEYFEWMDILQAVLEAGETFTMLELGAAYGRWSSRAALAARQLGKPIRLGLAEAEPKHQEWLRQHMADNEVSPSEYRAFDFAVGGSVGEVVFSVAVPGGRLEDTHFGHAVMPTDLTGVTPKGDYYGKPVYEVNGWGLIRIEQQPLSVLLNPYDKIDIIDFDLQGAEADAIAEALPLLTAKVRRLHIGTHGHEIEARLRDLLSGAGWICLRDFPCHGRHDTPFGPCDFVDGVQSWVNPARL
jgi:FkbM family methyltransferase